ncbi:alkene reductase [Candidatus Sodalis endolongispinus]|uniref:Alkene reductase n=1 Tax=Candidatus Sodalis endolongispinus TaxID=2812662 RepID=A0ABS5YCI7_9GAMM|nr:alkene reductase [Candidatus Sodalis endolongispinus]MBT9432730.1 alkene reductase [Candidatus Sodalis endolongispinus]
MAELFEPVKIGAIELANRIVMATLTRMRTDDQRVPGALAQEYYAQRASAGLIVTEATSVSPQGVGYPNTPGIWSPEQTEGWTQVTAAVHRVGGKIVCQLWHVGRISDPVYLDGELPVAPSAIAPEGFVSVIRPQKNYVTPRALATDEIAGIVEDYRRAAENAKRSGFDGVELHAANGYLFDQFLHDGSNKRTDRYGGSIANRARFLLEAVDALLTVWPADRLGVHLNLMSDTHSMRDSDPKAMFSYVARELNARGLAFIFAREALDFPNLLAPTLREHFHGALIVNEGFTGASAAAAVAAGATDAVAFGRLYIANPDLVARLRDKAPLNEVNPQTLYARGAEGYTDHPAIEDQITG